MSQATPYTGAGRRIEALAAVARALESFGHRRGWRGSDPYDGLNATRLIGPLRRFRRGRQLVIQGVKRSPLNLRPLLGVPPSRSSAAIAHVVSSYALGGVLDSGLERERLDRALDMLLDLRVSQSGGVAWGYHFDVQTRVFFYPAEVPNTIATAFAGMALLDAYARTGEERLVAPAQAAGEFFLRHVPQTSDPPGAYFGYLEGDRTPIHNASLLACSLLARLHAASPREEFAAAVAAGLEHALARQRPEGSWVYGEASNLRWVDGYHTGYVLQALMTCSQAGLYDPSDGALERGLEYYWRALFMEDGMPKFTSTSLYPIDAECVAQGIQTFARANMLERAWAIFDFAVSRMRRDDGGFVYQRGRLCSIRTPHIRWVAAPLLLAFVHLLRAAEQWEEGPADIRDERRDA